MTYEERQCRDLLRRNEVILIKELDAMELMVHLPCLPKQSKEGIEAENRERGRTRGMMKLLDELPRRDRWHHQFVEALHHPDINKPALAQLIFPSRKSDTTGKELPLQLSKKTPLRKLPYEVCDVLKRLDHQDGWKKIASELELTIEDVQRIECYPDCGSCTLSLITQWSHKSGATLYNLMSVLDKVERYDILDELSRIKGMEKIDFPKSVLNCYTMEENKDLGSCLSILQSKKPHVKQDSKTDFVEITVGSTVCLPPEDEPHPSHSSCGFPVSCSDRNASLTMTDKTQQSHWLGSSAILCEKDVILTTAVHPESVQCCDDAGDITGMCTCDNLDKQVEDKTLHPPIKNSVESQSCDILDNPDWKKDISIHTETNHPPDESTKKSMKFDNSTYASTGFSVTCSNSGHSSQDTGQSFLLNDAVTAEDSHGSSAARSNDFQIPTNQIQNFRLFTFPWESPLQQILKARWLYFSVGGALCLNYMLTKK